MMDRLRHLSAGSYPLSVATTDADGLAVTVASAAAITIANGAGVSVFTGAPTIAGGKLSIAVPFAALADLDVYSCLWSGIVAGEALQWSSQVEIAGGYLYELSDLRAFDPAFASATAYPGATLRAARTAAEVRLERAAGVGFVPRAARIALVGDGRSRLVLPDVALRRLVSVSIDGTALAPAELAALTVREWGAIDRATPWAEASEIAVHYEHGLDFPPAPVSTAAMILSREYLVRSALSSRATVEQTDVGFFRLSIAGGDRATGIPDVDAVIEQFGRRRPVVA